MAKMIVLLEWDDKLGLQWMNKDNLNSLLYGHGNTRPDLLKSTDVTGKVQKAFLATHTGTNILGEVLK